LLQPFFCYNFAIHQGKKLYVLQGEDDMFYKVMLVDDEEEVRFAIERKLDWNALGFEVVATAENGQEALEKAIEYEPDVVMTDIHMPFMNGLDFSRKLKEELPATKVVIFSGYDEFEYAKEAIKIEAEEYILKPIDAEELKSVFTRIKNRLDEELDERRNIENLERFYKESLPLLREQFLIALLEGSISKERIPDNALKYGLNLNSNYYSVCTFRFSTDSRSGDELSTQEGLLAVSLNQIVKDKVTLFGEVYSINYLDRVVVICGMKEAEEYVSFVNQIDMVCKFASKLLGVGINAGVGNCVSELSQITEAFKEARDAVSYRILLGENQAISIRDVEPQNTSKSVISDNQIMALVKEIKIGDTTSVTAAIDDIISTMKNASVAIYQLELTIVQIYLEILKMAKSYDLSQEDLKEYDIDIYLKIKEITSLEELRQWLVEKALGVRGLVKKERIDSTKLLMENAKSFISEHYSQSDISVDMVCSHLGVSPTYFSALFKKDTGVSFVTYLTNLRMEKALELLNTTDDKTYVIASKIGYDEPNYFSYVFKKAFGISPSKYRATKEA